MSRDTTTTALFAAIDLVHRGDHTEAREALSQLHATLAPDDHFHHCVLAHFLADVQPSPDLALHWDRRALAAAEAAAPSEFDDRFPGMTHASFFPSLLLNLAASCESAGFPDEARTHAQRALALPIEDSPLGRHTRHAIERLCTRLGLAAQ